ncbi:hypothetical protein EVAR_44400_1 [Eumeta japonica]|uniref:Uncharacterized protein n=1 Tax=Eumeta variegata TaxID=151549 RepID=A0A4C1XUA7_EUMVA|nr:hypothetical protein EVAR_44400_1 [Eumeta japonica]
MGRPQRRGRRDAARPAGRRCAGALSQFGGRARRARHRRAPRAPPRAPPARRPAAAAARVAPGSAGTSPRSPRRFFRPVHFEETPPPTRKLLHSLLDSEGRCFKPLTLDIFTALVIADSTLPLDQLEGLQFQVFRSEIKKCRGYVWALRSNKKKLT